MATDEFVERVAFQQKLDDDFPNGGYVTMVDVVPGGFGESGIQLSVGRLFCAEVRLVDGDWTHQVVVDDSLLFDEPHQELRVWVYTLDLSENFEGLWEAEIWNPGQEPEDDWPVELLRVDPAPLGSRRVKAGQREAVTEIWFDELFPGGLEVPVAPGDTG